MREVVGVPFSEDGLHPDLVDTSPAYGWPGRLPARAPHRCSGGRAGGPSQWHEASRLDTPGGVPLGQLVAHRTPLTRERHPGASPHRRLCPRRRMGLRGRRPQREEGRASWCEPASPPARKPLSKQSDPVPSTPLCLACRRRTMTILNPETPWPLSVSPSAARLLSLRLPARCGPPRLRVRTNRTLAARVPTRQHHRRQRGRGVASSVLAWVRENKRRCRKVSSPPLWCFYCLSSPWPGMP